jgi:hypothetical protein
MEPAAHGLLKIHGWVTNWNATDAAGVFQRDRDCVVTLELSRIDRVELTDHLFPSIIFNLSLVQEGSGWTVTWGSSYGAAGTISAGSVRVSLAPGKPAEDE